MENLWKIEGATGRERIGRLRAKNRLLKLLRLPPVATVRHDPKMVRMGRMAWTDPVVSTICLHRNRQRDDNRSENLELWARGNQLPGARVSDLVTEALRIIRLYAPESSRGLGLVHVRPCRRWRGR